MNRNYSARAQPIFCSLNSLFSDVPVAVAVVVFLSSLIVHQERDARIFIVQSSFPFRSAREERVQDLDSSHNGLDVRLTLRLEWLLRCHTCASRTSRLCSIKLEGRTRSL